MMNDNEDDGGENSGNYGGIDERWEKRQEGGRTD